MSKLNVLIDALDAASCNPKEWGDGWRAQCPVHGSRGGTLAVKLSRDGSVLLTCFAGCDRTEVLRSVGLGWADLREQNSTWKPRIRVAQKQPTFRDPLMQARAFGCEVRAVGSGVFVGSCPCGGDVVAGRAGACCSNGCSVESVGQFLRDTEDALRVRKEIVMPTRVLEVLMCSEERRGVSQKNGQEWVIYKVQANDENGQPISEKLQSFSDLPVGRGEYEIERRDHEKFGTSYTVKDPNARRVPPPPARFATLEMHEALQARVDALESRMGFQEVTNTTVAPSSFTTSDPVPF